jgi:hypothetical protein
MLKYFLPVFILNTLVSADDSYAQNLNGSGANVTVDVDDACPATTRNHEC